METPACENQILDNALRRCRAASNQMRDYAVRSLVPKCLIDRDDVILEYMSANGFMFATMSHMEAGEFVIVLNGRQVGHGFDGVRGSFWVAECQTNKGAVR